MSKNLMRDFSQPSSLYRGKPFWAWNGDIEESEARRQIKVLKEMGFGGGFMHSRIGLATPYLSKKWFKLINACIDESKKHDMEAWLYDEDRWPSGAAGGLVTKNPKYRLRFLQLSIFEITEFKPENSEIAIFAVKYDGNKIQKYRRISAKKLSGLKPDEKIFSFKCVLSEPSSWYNGQTYLDTLSQKAASRFIKVTHDAYAKNCGTNFGKTVPGIFTDEPNHEQTKLNEKGGITPWTDDLPKIFRKIYGYDIRDKLPELFFEIGGAAFSKVRHDYRETLSFLFTNSFAKQIFDWCEKNNILFTGHVLAEGSLQWQMAVGSSTMRFYEYMQAPGIDILCAQGLKRDGGAPPEYLTAKQCCSVLDQFDRKWMLSELYGCTGWHFTFAEYKAVGDWQAALGVNLRCQHLSWYTMKGEAKRDFPASIFFQSPWWRDYPVVEDYFSRVNVLMTQGKAVRDIAVIHPIESAWGFAIAETEGHKLIENLDAQLKILQNFLLEEHFDFDYVDEDILSRHGAVDNVSLRVAKSKYNTVIIPPAVTIRGSTLNLLKKFKEAGGKLIFIRPIPNLVNAEPSDEIRKLVEKSTVISLDRAQLSEKLLNNSPELKRVSIRAKDGKEYNPTLYMLRHDLHSGRHFLFVCHTLQEQSSGPIEIEIPAKGQVQEWDAQNGKVFLANFAETGKGVKISTEFAGYGSRLFVVDPNPDSNLKIRENLKETKKSKVEGKKWSILRDEPNAFPLDRAEYSINGGAWQKAKEILKIDQCVRDYAGIPRRGGTMAQPWAQEKSKDTKTFPLSLRYNFEVKEIPFDPCYLVMENPEKFKVLLNGSELKHDEGEGWWLDTSFKKLRVAPSLIRKGENELILQTNYEQESGLEALYFTGNFGFYWNGITPVISKLPDHLKLGNWVNQGFACYTGSMTYKTEFNADKKSGRVFIEIPSWKGALAKVRINGHDAGKLPWPPYEVDATDYIRDGNNSLEIEIVGTRRNLLGPLHLTNKYPIWTGPEQFISEGAEWTDEYISLPYGLMEPPILSFRQSEIGSFSF